MSAVSRSVRHLQHRRLHHVHAYADHPLQWRSLQFAGYHPRPPGKSNPLYLRNKLGHPGARGDKPHHLSRNWHGSANDSDYLFNRFRLHHIQDHDAGRRTRESSPVGLRNVLPHRTLRLSDRIPKPFGETRVRFRPRSPGSLASKDGLYLSEDEFSQRPGLYFEHNSYPRSAADGEDLRRLKQSRRAKAIRV